MASKKKIRLQNQVKGIISAGYDNFAEGMLRAFSVDPRLDQRTGTQLRSAFRAAYSLFEWCRTIKGSGRSRFLLVEIRSALSLAIALAGIGLYEVAHLQLRYACECVLSFLYFRDHPRELELALTDADQWDLTRPKAVIKFLRKLPEFASPIGHDLINSLDVTYAELCRYAHPRRPFYMGQRRYLTQVTRDAERARSFTRSVKALCGATSGVFWLAYSSDYTNSGEVVRVVLRLPIKSTLRNRIVAHLRKQCR